MLDPSAAHRLTRRPCLCPKQCHSQPFKQPKNLKKKNSFYFSLFTIFHLIFFFFLYLDEHHQCSSTVHKPIIDFFPSPSASGGRQWPKSPKPKNSPLASISPFKSKSGSISSKIFTFYTKVLKNPKNTYNPVPPSSDDYQPFIESLPTL